MLHISCCEWNAVVRTALTGIVLVGIGGIGILDAHPGHSRKQNVSLGQTHTRKILIVSRDGCLPCARLEKQIDALRQLAGNQVSVEVAKNIPEQVMQMYNVHIGGLPTILIILDGKVVQTLEGFRVNEKAQDLWNKIDKAKLQLS